MIITQRGKSRKTTTNRGFESGGATKLSWIEKLTKRQLKVYQGRQISPNFGRTNGNQAYSPGLFLKLAPMKPFTCLLLLLSSINLNAQCDVDQRPVVFIHGFLASGDTWSNAVKFFQQSGYCKNRLFAFDWNSVGGNGKQNEQLLAQFIEQVKKETGAIQVDFIGHSAGGGLARSYLKDSVQANNIAHYVHIGSRKWTEPYTWFPNERCLNIFSTADRVAGTAAGPVEGAKNLALNEEDHYQVATSIKALAGILNFLAPTKTAATELLTTKKKVEISGKAVLLGDNMPMKNASVTIYMIKSKNGNRTRKPAISLLTTENGAWGPVILQAGMPYEIELLPGDTKKKKISYFFNSFEQDNSLVYLRGFPEGNRISSLLGKFPEEEKQSALVLYAATGALIGGRDSVTVNRFPICSKELTPASKTIITSFIFDDGDGVSSGKTLKQFTVAPFIGGVDRVLPAGKDKKHQIYYNGKLLTVPALPSKDRIILAVLN